jgi:acyl-CoA thioesterase FadM
MYPVLRMIKELAVHSRSGSLPPFATHVSKHICWPWDLDMWMELNNGRTLTLYDLGRIPMAHRSGLIRALTRNRWGLTMAGAIVRYRRRVRVFDRLEMRSHVVGWDERFFYIEQSMWKGGECTSNIVYRAAVTDSGGIVASERVLKALGASEPPPKLPDWIEAWIAAEAMRPWPPRM